MVMFGIVTQLKRIADALEKQINQQERIHSLAIENLALSRMQAQAYIHDVEARIKKTTPSRDAGGKFAKKAPQTFTVILRDFGENKINTIKPVREVLHNSLKDALDLVNRAPTVLVENASKAETGIIASLFFGVAEIEIKAE
jgi:large subunit ribosomal protein L7/L12